MNWTDNKDELEKYGITEELAAFLTDELKNKQVNAEGLALGDEITLLKPAEKVTSANFDNKERKWADFACDGAAATISISRLIGTRKITKYFDVKRNLDKEGNAILEPDSGELYVEISTFKPENILKLSTNRVWEAYVEVAKMIYEAGGKLNLRVVGIARGCGRFNQTFYLFEKF